MRKISVFLCLLLCAAMLAAPLSIGAYATGTGTESDPIIITTMPFEATVTFSPDANGNLLSVYYQYTATRACRLNISVVGEAVAIVFQNGSQVIGSADIFEGDIISIELLPLLEGDATLKLSEEDFPLGSRYNPIDLSFDSLKKGYKFDLTQEDSIWYKVVAPETGVLEFMSTDMPWGFRLGFNGNTTTDQCTVIHHYSQTGTRPVSAGETFLLCAEYGAADPGSFSVKVSYVPPFTIDEATQKVMFNGRYDVKGNEGDRIFGVEFDYDRNIVSVLDIKNNNFLGTYNMYYNLENGALELTNKRGDKAPYTISVVENPEVALGAHLTLGYNGNFMLNALDSDTKINVPADAIDLLNGRFEDIFMGEVYETFVFVFEPEVYNDKGEVITPAGDQYVIVAPDWQSEGVVYQIESYSVFSGLLVLKSADGDEILMNAAGGQIIYNENVLTEVHEHKYSETVTYPTCTEGGHTVFTCSCGETYTGAYTDALGHDWVEASCEDPKHCSRCRISEGAALGHKWVDATCDAPKTCSVCGNTEGEALGHSWVEATCDAPKTCTNCNATEGEALGHKWVDATCETAKTCATCGKTEGEALGHKWVDATCETAKTCSACGKTEGTALGHSYGKWTDNGDNHKQICAGCGDVITEDHAWNEGEVIKEATEEQDGEKKLTCTVCGATKIQIIPSLSHVHSHTAVITDPTCTEAGYTTYTCGCGDSYTEKGAAALGHSYKSEVTKPTCTEGGYTTHTCTACGDVKVDSKTNAAGHKYDSVVTKPTCTAGGYTTHTCTVCGDVKVDSKTDMIDHSYGAGVPSGDKVVYTCTVCGHSYEETVTVKPGEIEIPGTLTGIVDGSKEFVWTATVDGFLQIDNVSTMTGANHSVTINGEPAIPTEEGYAVTAGDQVVITITTFSAIEINIPMYVNGNGGSGEGDSPMEFDVSWSEGSWEGYIGYWTAPADGTYSFIIASSNIPADGLTFSIMMNEGQNWYNQYEFPVDAEGRQYITVTVSKGDLLTIGAYDDAHIVAGQLHIQVIEGEPAPHEHTFDEGVVTKEPTCTAEGILTYTCATCGETKTEKVEKLAHTEEVIPGKAPTCTEPGLTDGVKCAACGEIITQQTEIAVADHSYGEWETVKEPTTTEEGSRKRVCAACGAEETESIPVVDMPEPTTKPTEPATKPSEEPTTAPTTQPGTTGGDNAGDNEGGNNTLIIVIVAVVVIAGAIVAVVVFKKKK